MGVRKVNRTWREPCGGNHGNKYMEETSGTKEGMGNVHVGRFFFVLRVLPLGYTILLHRFSRVPAIKTEGLFSESCSKGGKQKRERKRERGSVSGARRGQSNRRIW